MAAFAFVLGVVGCAWAFAWMVVKAPRREDPIDRILRRDDPTWRYERTERKP